MNPNLKLGVLGGGQLGKMLSLAAANWHLPIYILDASREFPAGRVCTKFVEGDFKNYDDVYRFGKMVDLLTIEIEHVNTAALLQLQKEGLDIHPNPAALNIIKDKGLQKEFYENNGLPTATFRLFDNEEQVKREIEAGGLSFPFVQKARTAGYDGRGVALIRNKNEAAKLIKGACIIEPLVDIRKELAVLVARNKKGQIAIYPPVEMEFNPDANLVEYLICPAGIDSKVARAAEDLAREAIQAFDICGLLAVEFFLTPGNQLLINEVAPRTHNSGHHTIDSCYTSQFEQHLRAVLNLPLGSTKMKSPSVMVNLLGAEGYDGPAQYEGLRECLAMEGVSIHLYGKKMTKPFRKMGHATILDEVLVRAKEKARRVKDLIRIVG